MSSAEDGLSTTERELALSKVRLDRAVENYSQSQRLGAGELAVASEELHTAVIGLWWRMRPVLKGKEGWEDLSDLDSFESDEIWSGQHPQTGEPLLISGLSDLKHWVDRTATIETAATGPRRGRGGTREVSVRLPAPAAIRAGEVLTTRFNDLGWDVEPEDGLPGESGFDPAGEELVERKQKNEIMPDEI